MDEISGSTAITGACDTLMLLKRIGTKGTLYCQGRDIDEIELALEGDLVNRTWTLLGDAQQLGQSSERQRILDFGCGPGRDLAELTRRGQETVGLDGAERFVQMAREHSGCEVLQQDFVALDLEPGSFDGIFANASLFHVPISELARVLAELASALRSGGVLFSYNPRGDNKEGWNGARFGAYHDLEAWRRYLETAGFSEVEHYYRPTGLPRSEQPWLASVWRKPAT